MCAEEVVKLKYINKIPSSDRLLTLAAIFLWLVSVVQAKLNFGTALNLSLFGLAQVLPTTFFVSISLLTFSFLINLGSRKKNQMLFFLQIMLLISFLNLTPTLIEGTPRFTATYISYRSVDYVSQYGYINPLAQLAHNWPSFDIAYSAFLGITGLQGQDLVRIYPMFFNLILLFPLFVFFRLATSDEKKRWIAVWVFYIANWIGQDYFSMQSLGLLTFVLILYVMFKLINSQAHNRHLFVALFLLFFLIVTTHMLSSLFALAVICMFFAVRYLPRRPVLILVFAGIFFAWTSYGAATNLQWNLPSFVQQAFNLDLILHTNVTTRLTVSATRATVTQIRLIFLTAILVFAFSGFILTLKRGKMKKIDKMILVALIGILLLFGFNAYGGELWQRIFLFSLIPLSYFISKCSNWKALFCFLSIFLVVIAPPLHMIAHYGNEAMDYVPPGEIRGGEFFDTKTVQGYVIGGYRDLNYHQSYGYFSLSDATWNNDAFSLGWIKDEHLNWPRFVCISYWTKEYYSYLKESLSVAETVKNLTKSVDYDRIYSNPDCDFYLQLRH